MKETLQFGSRSIEYTVVTAKRKSLGITVRPDMSVIVQSPEGASPEKIQALMRKRAPWIVKQQRFFLGFHPRTPERKYLSGESILYMGRQYRLKVLQDSEKSVKLKGKFIEVNGETTDEIKSLLDKWYAAHAKSKFPDIAAPLIERFKRYGVEPSGFVVRQMSLRWGSCTPKGKIILNLELIKAPKGCIEYVIIHELCHLIHHNHTRQFMEFQKKEMPQWEKWKMKLENLLS